MKKRSWCLICFLALLAIETAIALFVHDHFVRPYVGDALVTLLLCCFVRCFFPYRPKWLALYVFLFSVAVEISQLVGIADRLHIENAALRVLLGATFDFKDIFCYFVGCAVFFAAESWLAGSKRENERR